MAKQYTSVPTAGQWRKDMGVTGLVHKTEFPAMERIAELLDIFYSADHRLKALKYETMAQALRHAAFILRYRNDKAKLGTTLWSSRVETVQALHDYLQQNYAIKAFEDDFGKDVTAAGKHEDDRFVQGNIIQWYRDKAARTQFKLSFRGGLAHRWAFDADGRKVNLGVYDTDQFGDALEERMSLYVMDTQGRIYVSGREGEQSLKHSSFLAGDRTLAAGTMRIERGQIVWVSGRSGHYQPSVQQMLNILERLRGFQVNMNKVTVYRENFVDAQWVNKVPRRMEPTSAVDLMRRRAWPGFEPNKMRVG